VDADLQASREMPLQVLLALPQHASMSSQIIRPCWHMGMQTPNNPNQRSYEVYEDGGLQPAVGLS
jgi:hypothetical protein